MANATTDVGTRDRARVPIDTVGLLRQYAGPLFALVATAWWLIEVTRAWAGRDAPSVTVGAALLAVAVLLVRPDRVLPRTAVYLATAVSAAAFVVPLTAPTGWTGAPDGALYACGAWLAVTVAAVLVARPEATVLLVILVAASAPIEFMSGWLSWWGGKDPTAAMQGTFYWHNPFAAFLVPGGLIGLALWIWRERVIALLGLVSFALATVGVVYSTSRASLAIFALGFALVVAVAAVDGRRWRALRQLAVAAVLAAGATFFVGGPPFFPHRASPLAATQARTAGQSLSQNGGYRLDFWHQALGVFSRHPLTGGGYKSLVRESIGHVPAHSAVSPYAHNGYLQALGEGGLVLAIPFLLGIVVLAFLCLRILVRGVIRRRVAPETVVVAIAFGCVLLHSGVDFDWTYAADFALAAVLAGLVLGYSLTGRAAPADAKPGRARAAVLALCVLVGVGALGVSAWVQRNGNHAESILSSAQRR